MSFNVFEISNHNRIGHDKRIRRTGESSKNLLTKSMFLAESNEKIKSVVEY